MKKTVLLIVVLCVGASLLCAAPYANNQKIFSLDSDVYEAIAVLYVSQGLSLPSTTGPYSEAELLLMLEKIDADVLPEALKDVYGYVVQALDIQPKLQNKGVGLSWNLDATLETYVHQNTTDFVGRDSWIRGYMDQKPMLSIALETWPSDSFYGYSEFTIGNGNSLQGSGDGNGFGSTTFATNLILVAPAVLTDLDFNMPYRAFVAMGGDYWTAQVGRDRMSWGAGESGNLMMGDNLKYHNLARFTAFGTKYKYTFVTSFFPYPDSYISDDSDAIQGDSQGDALHGLNMFMAHRLEWRMLNDKVGFTLNESIMYQSKDNTLDLRILNPVMIFHDYYIRSNANSLLSIEIDYTPFKGLNIYGQAMVDEFSLPGEAVPSETEVNYPQTFGYLAGMKYTMPVGDLVAHASLEFVYTDPFLYLRYATASESSATDGDEYGLNYVGVIREFTNYCGTRYHSEFLGYTYGNDAIVFNVNTGVKRYGQWNVEANGFFMWHGTMDIYSMWSRIGGSSGVPYNISTPTTSHPTGNYNDSDVSDRNSVSQTMVLGVNGAYDINEHLHVFGQLDYININNYENVAGSKASDVQLTMGATYSL
ncbi:MAG: hypothetical protein AB9828_02160 [Sphaerochaetaceae bacterium]